MKTILKSSQSIFLALVLTACNGAPPEQTEPAEAPDAGATATELQPGDHQWTTADGNRIPYTVTGEGDATVLLVHCWMCDRSFWSNQVPVLAQRYRTIAVDLPGHGEATANREPWTIAAYGEDVAGLMEALDLSNVVLVGHSMGGPVSLRAAALAGDRVRGIVAVDTLHDAEFEFSDEQMAATIAGFESDFVGTCGNFVRQMFPEEGVDATENKVLETSCTAERKEVGSALMKDFGNVDAKRWFSEAGVPIRAINAAGGMPTRIESNRKYADFDAVSLQGVGHYLHMTRPAEFNPLLLAAIAEILNETP